MVYRCGSQFLQFGENVHGAVHQDKDVLPREFLTAVALINTHMGDRLAAVHCLQYTVHVTVLSPHSCL